MSAPKVLLRFSKQGVLKYTSHLDTLRMFQRTLRRAGLPVCYSQGFNPHMLLSFALPLPLGMESLNDYAELALAEPLPPDEISARFNAAAPRGLALTGLKYKEEGRKSAAALTMYADYAFYTESDAEAAVQSILNEESVIVLKKTKRGSRETDVRSDIANLRRETSPPRVVMRLAAGSERFLNPRLITGLLFERMGVSADAYCPITRLELYDAEQRCLFGELL